MKTKSNDERSVQRPSRQKRAVYVGGKLQFSSDEARRVFLEKVMSLFRDVPRRNHRFIYGAALLHSPIFLM